MNAQLMVIVAEGQRGRVYLAPNKKHIAIANQIKPIRVPETDLPDQALGFRVQLYGMTKHSDLFTTRQLVALTTFSELIEEERNIILKHISSSLPDNISLVNSNASTTAYADAIAAYLACAIDRSADFWSTIATWSPQTKNELVMHTFTRQTMPMTWDYAEANPFSSSGGNFEGNLGFIIKVVQASPLGASPGLVRQLDATNLSRDEVQSLISTDPPYYDNIGYADLSDFFYVWLRRSLRDSRIIN